MPNIGEVKLIGATARELLMRPDLTGRVLAVAGPGIAAWATQKLTKWIDPLPIMPVAVPPALDGGLEIPDPVQPGKKADFYAMECRESTWQFHSQLPPAKANSYGYAGAKLEYATAGQVIPDWGYLGPSIVALKGKAGGLEMVNNLPLIPLYADAYDTTIGDGMAATYDNTSRIAVHLHGGFVPPHLDGHPDSCQSDRQPGDEIRLVEGATRTRPIRKPPQAARQPARRRSARRCGVDSARVFYLLSKQIHE